LTDPEIRRKFTAEDYVKAIHEVCSDSGKQVTTTGELAKRLEISSSTVSCMLRPLADSGLVIYRAYKGVRLSDAGQALALRILRRHRLLKLFLVNTLGIPWHEAHEEAGRLQHAASNWLMERIDEYLQHPDRHPHGDPIPQDPTAP